MKKIKIKYLSEEIEKLRYIDGKSDWIDLRAAEEVTLVLYRQTILELLMNHIVQMKIYGCSLLLPFVIQKYI